METRIIPVLLAGGVGSRLWPISRESYPKQFCKLFGNTTLLQQTAERAKSVAGDSELIIVTNDNYYFLCKDQLETIGISNVHYLLEPCSKNTAPAIALAAKYIYDHIDPEAALLVLPSDHQLKDNLSFQKTVKTAVNFANQGEMVVFGVTPTAPKTGYGYIEKGEALGDEGYQVSRFVEKPSLKTAEKYLEQGNFYWNSGMFLFKAKDYLVELKQYANDIYAQSIKAYEATQSDDKYFRISQAFCDCREGSIDYEVMEKTSNAVMLPLSLSWNDLGCWSSVGESADADADGNVCYGDVMVSKSENCLINSEGHRVVAIGIKNQVVVSTSDAILVIDKQYAQDVKAAVQQMKLAKDSVATEHKRIYRPWGFYEQLASGENYQVKHLMISPGAAISLQLHHHRSEHWVVVSGEAEVINGEQVLRLHPNQSTYIDKETKHRLSNPGTEPLCVIEVQSGSYLGEDDIVRFDDVYGRASEAEAIAKSETV